MPLDSLDLSFETSPQMLDHPITDRRAWVSGDIDPSDSLVHLDDAALGEVAALVDALHDKPMPLLLRSPEDFDLPAWRIVMDQAKARLNDGLGFAVVDALPMDDYEIDDMIAVYWIVGQLLGRTVAQKWDGTMIYDVTDTGRQYGYGVRGSYTSVELVFHTDNAFGVQPPEYVGLLCKYPAVSGGISRFCSLYSVHNRMLEKYPELLNRLYAPMHFDRQAEHAPDAPKTALAPFFSYDGTRLTARANVSLVRKGYEVAELELEPELADALEAVETVGNQPEFWLEQPIERGHLQYLNNVELGHYRSHFEDHKNPEKKRHLIRTWHRDAGGRSYDG
ncbi:MAG: TauD/TfdA family dioxygenase [Rhodospirillaceae bacterium]|nr:TauD/TfdA family dioxygenase [Rhodospirillaceae bacterium]